MLSFLKNRVRKVAFDCERESTVSLKHLAPVGTEAPVTQEQETINQNYMSNPIPQEEVSEVLSNSYDNEFLHRVIMQCQ